MLNANECRWLARYRAVSKDAPDLVGVLVMPFPVVRLLKTPAPLNATSKCPTSWAVAKVVKRTIDTTANAALFIINIQVLFGQIQIKITALPYAKCIALACCTAGMPRNS